MANNAHNLCEKVNAWPDDLLGAYQDLESASARIRNLMLEVETARLMIAENSEATSVLHESISDTAQIVNSIEWIVNQNPKVLAMLIERLEPGARQAIREMVLNSSDVLPGNGETDYAVMDRKAEEDDSHKNTEIGVVQKL